MAMIEKKDKPALYNIVGEKSGAVLATAYKSNAFKVRKQLQEQYNGEKLIIVPCLKEE